MTSLEKKNTRIIRAKAIFMTVIIYSAILGGLLMYLGGREDTIPQKIKTFFLDQSLDKQASSNIPVA